MDMATPKRYSGLKANTFSKLCLKLNVDFSHLQFGVVNCCSMTMSCRFSRPNCYLLGGVLFTFLNCHASLGIQMEYFFVI